MAKEATITNETTAADSTTGAAVETGAAAESNTANAKIVPLLDKALLKNLRTALGGDRVRFETDSESTAYAKLESHLEAAAAACVQKNEADEVIESAPFYGLPFVVRQGGEADSIVNANCITLATVGVRDKEKNVNGIKAIVAFESPTVADFLTSESDTVISFIQKVIERETADVAFAMLRAPDMTYADLESAVAGMPASVDDIVTTSRESGGVDTDAFDTLWLPFKNGFLKAKAPNLAAAMPTKTEVQKAIRSAAYAMSNPRTRPIEEKGAFKRVAELMIELAPNFKTDKGEPAPVDSASIQEWLDGRNSLALQYNTQTVDASKLEINF